MIILIIGVGLVGGSMALALKRSKFCDKIIGIDIDEKNLKVALDKNIVDEALKLDEAIKKSDIIILSSSIDQNNIIAKDIIERVDEFQIIMDVGSTKQAISSIIDKSKNRKRFVLTHPIAGTEKSGVLNAFADMVKGKNVIICDKHKSDKKAFKTVCSLYENIGMKVITMNPIEHDLHCAYISHISHISSFVLGNTVLDIEHSSKIFDMAGSGFDSTVRLAKSSASTWAPIFIENSDNIIKAIDVYTDNLSKLRKSILKKDYQKIKEFIDKSNKIFDFL